MLSRKLVSSKKLLSIYKSITALVFVFWGLSLSASQVLAASCGGGCGSGYSCVAGIGCVNNARVDSVVAACTVPGGKGVQVNTSATQAVVMAKTTSNVIVTSQPVSINSNTGVATAPTLPTATIPLVVQPVPFVAVPTATGGPCGGGGTCFAGSCSWDQNPVGSNILCGAGFCCAPLACPAGSVPKKDYSHSCEPSTVIPSTCRVQSLVGLVCDKPHTGPVCVNGEPKCDYASSVTPVVISVDATKQCTPPSTPQKDPSGVITGCIVPAGTTSIPVSADNSCPSGTTKLNNGDTTCAVTSNRLTVKPNLTGCPNAGDFPCAAQYGKCETQAACTIDTAAAAGAAEALNVAGITQDKIDSGVACVPPGIKPPQTGAINGAAACCSKIITSYPYTCADLPAQTKQVYVVVF